MKSSKKLKLAGIIQIILGVAMVLVTYFIIGNADISVTGLSAEKAFAVLIATYAGAAFQIIAGVLGVLLASKKSVVTVICGVILFAPVLINFVNVQHNIAMIISNAVLLILPYFYLHSAYAVFKNK